MPRYKVMEQIYMKNSLGGVSVAFHRMMESGFFDKYEMQTLEQESITHGIDPRVVLKYYREIKEKKPDLIHVRGVTEDGLMPIIAARLARVPHILIGVEGMYSDTYEIDPIKKLLAKYIIEPLSFRLATDIFTVYKGALQRPKIARYRKKIRGFVYNSMPNWNITNKNQIRRELRCQLCIPDENILICFISRINVDKGFSYLVDALSVLDQSWPEKLDIVVVGDGGYLQLFSERAKTLNNCSRIHIVGSTVNVKEYYFASDLFATCTLHENHSLSILEACAAHIPSIVTNTGGNTETIEDGVSGWVIPIKKSEAIVSILRETSLLNQSKLRQMGEKAYENAQKKFKPEIVYRNMQELYDIVLEQ